MARLSKVLSTKDAQRMTKQISDEFVDNNEHIQSLTNYYNKEEIDNRFNELTQSISKVDKLLAEILGTREEENALIDDINGEVV